ncbi:MAG: hypothetical protein H7333_07415 [Bdellovibrionales bacterium]|nr:hypothetical protein [Oligoflexia bacterium]
MKNIYKLTFFFLLSLGTAQAGVQDACLNTEHWTITKGNPNWLKEFHEFSGGRSTPIYGFSQAIQLKRMSQILTNAEFEHDFAEYWIARILFELHLDPLAHQALKSVFQTTANPDLKKAAYGCLARIQSRVPDWKAPPVSALSGLNFAEEDSDTLFMSLLGKESSWTKKLSSGHRGFLEGVNALTQKKYTDAIMGFKSYFKYLETHNNALLTRYQDEAHLFLGRAYYSVAKFPEASLEFQKVKKTSNVQIEALMNLSWTYLLSEKHDDAVGITLQLRTGNLKNTFSAEAVMVAAMGLNELCNYPDSIRMIEAFNKDYRPVHDWLTKHPNEDGYVSAVKALKNPGIYPVKLATEWIRSPEFLTRQQEINALLNEPKHLSEVEATATAEQARLSNAFVQKTAQFLKDYRVAKLQLKPGQDLPKEFPTRYLLLKKELRKLSHFYRASKTWRVLARNYEKKIPGLKLELVAKVNTDLKAKNKKLLATLDRVKDNTDLIEVEIFNGASQDLVWKSAHPDFEKVSQSLDEEKRAESGAHTWNWGRFLASNLENAEVWEDELGAVKADVTDQCGKKDRFLQLKLIKR